MKIKTIFSVIVIVFVFLGSSGLVCFSAESPQYDNPLSVGSFTELAGNLLGALQKLVGYLTIIMIIVGGLIYMISAGKQGLTTLAKNIIGYALVGFILVIAIPTILEELKRLVSGGNGGGLTENTSGIMPVLDQILTFLLSIVGVLATISLIISAIMFFASVGSSNVDKAKKMIFYSVIAIAVSGGALIILNQVLQFFK